MAVVNDTVGTMMTCGFDDQRCEVGIIIGKKERKDGKMLQWLYYDMWGRQRYAYMLPCSSQ